MKAVIGLMGFKGSGKDTVASILESHDFVSISYADTLKQCLCTIFGWQMVMIEGKTKESREWRDRVDQWWARRLGIPDFTPRKAMTLVGTDVIRKYFHEDIWALSLEKKISAIDANVVVTDIRFKNEHQLISNINSSKIFRVRRHYPEWEKVGTLASMGDKAAIKTLKEIGVHESEWDWLSCDYAREIDNTGSFVDLAKEVEKYVLNN